MGLGAMGLTGTLTALCPGRNTGYKPFQNSAWEAGSVSPAGQCWALLGTFACVVVQCILFCSLL